MSQQHHITPQTGFRHSQGTAWIHSSSSSLLKHNLCTLYQNQPGRSCNIHLPFPLLWDSCNAYDSCTHIWEKSGGWLVGESNEKGVHTFPETESNTNSRSAGCRFKRCCLLCTEGEKRQIPGSSHVTSSVISHFKLRHSSQQKYYLKKSMTRTHRGYRNILNSHSDTNMINKFSQRCFYAFRTTPRN